MKIKLYQIAFERDPEYTAFEGLPEGQTSVNSYPYDLVFSGNVEAENLEDVFAIFNLQRPRGFKSRSLSVSDVVEIADGEKAGFYYCDVVGFQKVKFI